MRRLSTDTLVVFVSDSHIGGDPGCDGFEASDELKELFEEIGRHEGAVELILAGDFFDFLQIGAVPEGENRAKVTISRPEYASMFEALKRFREREGTKVIYLPGNHDAEVWWNSGIQETLRDAGLVDEFAYSYAADFEVGGEKRVVYCEHGNQFDPENTVEDYGDPLDTPLGHHVVMDFTRKIAPFGEVMRGLDLSEIKMIFPLSAVPIWVASRYFYNLVQRLATHLLLPILVIYALYRVTAYSISLWDGNTVGFFQSYRELPGIHSLLITTLVFGVLVVLIFAIFALYMRRRLTRSFQTLNLGLGHQEIHYDPAAASRIKIEAMLKSRSHPPMNDELDPTTVDVFVSGHTHLPSLDDFERQDGSRVIAVNSGCWLRQLQPTKPHIKGPPVFVSRFVLTHVRVYVQDDGLAVELWEWPRPAEQKLNLVERLVSRKHLRRQPGAGEEPKIRASTEL